MTDILSKQLLPSDLRIERTSNEPEEVRNKISSFDRNLLEAIIIVVLVSLVFMEWRSALLVAICIPVTVAFTLGLSQLVGIDLQQVSIAALIIALGLLVDAPVVAADCVVDDYADEGVRRRSWFVDGVIKYHRTIGTLLGTLQAHGFRLDVVDEPLPTPDQVVRHPHLAIHRRRPPVLLIGAGLG